MADKVQRILEDVLQESIYLVKKGIFSEGELKRQMTNRERLENSLSQKAIRTTHYLKAIEYEYEQERVRRYRESEESETVIDPKYKRASTKDFTILKRTIRLWDRTMHKYRFRIDLWKEYLAFCHTIKSKKAFYKALTNAIRFNPFELELWLSGAYYEFQVIKNPWKARKIFHKALKLNKSNIVFWKEYLRFECEFAEVILRRESALTEETVMKFEGEEVEHKLGQIDFKGVLKQVVEAALQSVPEDKKQDLIRQLSGVLGLYENESLLKDMIVDARVCLQQVVQSNVKEEDKLKMGLQINYTKYVQDLNNTFNEKSNDNKLQIVKIVEGGDKRGFLQQIKLGELSRPQKILYFKQHAALMKLLGQLDTEILSVCLKEMCLWQQDLSEFLASIIDIDPTMVFKKLINSKIQIPASTMSYYLDNYLKIGLSTFEIDETLKRTNKDYNNKQFMRSWARYNKLNSRDKENMKLLHSLKVANQDMFQHISNLLNQIQNQQ